MKVIAIIPAYNEEKTISQVIQETKPYVNQIVVVDDGSVDQTNELAIQEGVVVLKHLINRGQGAALRTGMEYIQMLDVRCQMSDIVIVHIDSDAQHHPEDIPKMIQPILEGKVEVTLGSRFLNKSYKEGGKKTKRVLDKKSQIPLGRKILLKGAIFINQIFTGKRLTDAHNGFRALSWKAANLIKINQDRMAHNSEIVQQIVKHNLKFQEVPIIVSYTKDSRLKGQTWWDGFKIIRDLIIGKVVR